MFSFQHSAYRPGRIICISVIVLLLTVSRFSHGENLFEVYQLAEKSDPQYREAEAAYRAKLEARPQALAQLLPNISLSANTAWNEQTISSAFVIGNTGNGNSVGYNSHGYSLSLTQPLFRWDRILQYRQADSMIQQSNAELLAAKQDLIIRVSESYFNLLAAYDNLDFARAEKLALSRQLDQAKQRFEVGLTAITDVQEAQAGYDRAVASEIAAENNIDNTREVLREIIGVYLTDYSPLGKDMPLLSPNPADIDKWTSQAEEQSLTVMAAIYAVDTAKEEISIRQAGHFPTLDLTAGAGYNKSGGRFGASKIHSSDVGLQLSVPLFSGGAVNSRTREAVELLNQQLLKLEQARRQAQSATRQAYLGVISGISQVKAFKQALVSSETALQATEAGFEVGTRTAVEVVTSQQNLLQARRDYAQARYNYVLDTLRLKQASGILSSDDLTAVSQWFKK